MITEQVTIDGQHYVVTWMPPPFRPPMELVLQVGGLCFTEQGQVLLVTADGRSWSLPGGHPEPRESIQDAFVREVREEACARVCDLAYIGCQKAVGPALDPDWSQPLHYLARFRGRVELLPFTPEHETTGRKAIPPSELIGVLNWSTIRCAEAMLSAALAEEQKRNSGCAADFAQPAVSRPSVQNN